MRRYLPTHLVILLTIAFTLIIFTGCDVEDGPDEYKTDNSTWTEIGGKQMPALRDACFASETEVVIVGDDGFAAFSTDRGNSWDLMENPAEGTNVRYYITHFKEGGTGFIAGRRAYWLSTTDYGTTWTNHTDSSMAQMHFSNQHFITDDLGYIIGSEGQLFKTEDCGQTFDYIGYISEDDIANDIYFLDENIGFAGGSREKRWKTTDGGNSWMELEDETVNDTTSRSIISLVFFDEDTGVVVGGDNAHKRTVNGGESWVAFGVGGEREVEILSVNKTGDREAYLATSGGDIWYTNDKGETWTSYPSSISGPIYEIGFYNNSIGWQVGTDNRISLGSFKITTDGGNIWEYRSYGIGTDLMDVDFLDINTGWVCGDEGYLYFTSDGGASWNHLESPTTENIKAIDFINESYGLAVGMRYKILKSTNGGINWFVSDSGDFDAATSYRDVQIIDESYAYICGTDATILKSVDGGDSWTPMISPLEVTWNQMYWFDRNKAYIVGTNGAFAKTTDGGESWTVKETNTLKSFLNIDVLSENNIWVCGEHTIMHSANGGDSWTAFDNFLSSNNLMAHYNDLVMFNSDLGWIVGDFAYRTHTVDGGETWYRQNSPNINDDLMGICKVGTQTAYAVGRNGKILRLEK